MASGIPIVFSHWLRARRRALDLTRERLALCVGCSSATIEKLESGERKPSRQIAELLARCLHIPDESLGDFVLFARGGPLSPAFDDLPFHPTSTSAGVHLPASPTEFVGRSAEMERVSALLQEPGVRLLTLLGPPGIGKTRLAIELASGMASYFEHGIYFAPLSGLEDASLVVPALASALEVRQWPHQPLLDTLVERLRDRRLLLVIDNFEHLLPAALDIGLLLSRASGLKVLATSRTALHIYGEHTFAVPPMSLPSPEDPSSANDPDFLSRYEATSLFVRRARAANHDFVLTPGNAAQVLAICRRLDGLPLAIELAANRARVLSPGQILEHLTSSLDLLAGGASDLPARQRSLRGAIAWGYDLLSIRAQRLFRLLSLFAGGCPLPALETLVTEMPALTMVDNLSALVDSSLVRRQATREGVRFSMLDTVREFASEQLAASGEAGEARRSFSAYYLRLAEQAEPELQGGDQETWLRRLEEEHDNLRSTYSYYSDAGDGVSLATLASSLRRFWYLHGHFFEGHAWLRQALTYEDRLPPTLLAKVLHGLGLLDWSTGDLRSAELHFNESLLIWRSLDDKRGIANMLNNLGIVLLPQCKFDTARAQHIESLQIYRDLEDTWGVALSLSNLGLVALDSGDYAEAEKLLSESLTLRRDLRDEQGGAQSLNNLGIVARCKGQIVAACALHNESLEMFRRIGDRWSTALALCNLAYAELKGELTGALPHLLESLSLFRDLGSRSGIVGCLEGLARIAGLERKGDLAASLLGASAKVRSDLSIEMAPYNQPTYLESRRSIVAMLGEEPFDAAYLQGSKLDVEAACSLALAAWSQ